MITVIPDEQARKRQVLASVGGMGAMPQDVVDRAALANPPKTVLTATPSTLPNPTAAAGFAVDPEKYAAWAKSQGLDPSKSNPMDIERWRQQQEASTQPPRGVGGVR